LGCLHSPGSVEAGFFNPISENIYVHLILKPISAKPCACMHARRQRRWVGHTSIPHHPYKGQLQLPDTQSFTSVQFFLFCFCGKRDIILAKLEVSWKHHPSLFRQTCSCKGHSSSYLDQYIRAPCMHHHVAGVGLLSPFFFCEESPF
jgi:hypothetical protein